MNVILATNVDMGKPTGVAQYWDRLIRSVKAHGIGVTPMPLDDAARRAVPGHSLVIVDNHDALAMPDRIAVVAVQHGNAGEHLARVPGWKAGVAMVPKQAAAGKRKHTYWVACSEWAAWCGKKWMGVAADYIVPGMVDTQAFAPSARQQHRTAGTPVVLHHCADPNKGSEHVEAIEAACHGAFAFRRLKCAPADVAKAMQAADIWLCLSAAEGLPTVLQEAAATGLCCVSTAVGVAWPAPDVPWVTTFHWREREKSTAVAKALYSAWTRHDWRVPHQHAVENWSMEVCGKKWVDALKIAALRLEVT